MAATIRTDTRRVTDISTEFLKLSKDIAACANTIPGIIGKLSVEVKSKNNIDSNLKALHTLLEACARDVQQGALVSAQGMQQFQKAEEMNINDISSSSSSGNNSNNTNPTNRSTDSTPTKNGLSNLNYINIDKSEIQTKNYTGSGDNDYVQKGVIAGIGFAGSKAIGAGIEWIADKIGINGGSDSSNSEFKKTGFTTGNTFDNSFGSGDYSVSIGNLEAKAGADYVFDPAGGNIAANASASASASLLKAQASISGKYGSADVGAEVGTATAAAKAGIGLMKDGNFNPTLNASVRAEVSALKGTAAAEAHDGTGYNVGVNAEGRVGTAHAGADISMDASKAEFSVNAGALAAAVSGTATAKADIGPIKGGVTVTGYAGGAGAKASASFKDGTLKFGAGAALGAGGGVEFEVGLGNWSKKLDEATDGAVSDAVAAGGNVLNAALTPVNAVVGGAKSIYDSGKDFVNAVKSGNAGAAVKAIVTAPIKVAETVGKAVVGGVKAVGSGIASAAKAVGKFLTSW